MADLTIKIDGDPKGYEEALKESEKATEEFQEQVKKVTEKAALTFAALTAEIGLSVHAFNGSENAVRQLTLALQNQGIYSAALIESYKKYAAVLAEASGLSGDNIIKAQAIAQSYLGQMKITQELTNAIGDLSETMGGDLNSAAEKIGRTIGTNTNAFAREGLQLSQTATEAERYQKVLEYIQNKDRDLAAQTGNTAGSLRGLHNTFDDLQSVIGSKFAPAVDIGIRALTQFLKLAKDNDVLINFATGIAAGGAALSGLVTISSQAFTAIAGVTTVLKALEIEISLVRLACIGLAGATGIGLLVVALGTLGTYLLENSSHLTNFKKNLPAAREEIAKLSKEIEDLEKNGRRTGSGELRIEDQGAIASRRKRIDEIKAMTAEAEAIEAKAQEKRDKMAKDEAAKREAHNARLVVQQQTHNELLIEENLHASQAYLEILQKQADTAAQIASTENDQEREILQYRYEQLQKLKEDQHAQDVERTRAFAQEEIDVQEEMYAQYGESALTLSEQQRQEILASKQTERDVLRQIEVQKLKDKVTADNEYLLNQKKFGTAYAALYKIMHSEIYNGVKSAFGDLAALQESENSTLKAIGKTAAVANIIIKTAEAAMNIYAGFSTIPIVGPALGIAGAAAAVAFGAEQVGKVTAAADGGVMQGGIKGVDSIPTLTMPGEIVAPSHNYEEVIGSVAAKREAEKTGLVGGMDSGAIVDKLAEISDKLDSKGGDEYHIHGDMMADDAYMESFLKRMSDFLRYKNGKLYGVNA